MVSRDHIYRLGNIVSDDDLPSIESLANSLADRSSTEAAVGERRGVRNVRYSTEDQFVYFVYVEDYENEYPGLNEESMDTMRTAYPRRAIKILITTEGNFVFESVQGIAPEDAINFVFEPLDQNINVRIIENLDRETMLNFYEYTLDKVKKFKVKEIGDHEPNPIDVSDRARDILDTFGDVVKYSENSTGQEGDTKDDELAEGMIGTSNPHMLRGEDSDGRIREYENRRDSNSDMMKKIYLMRKRVE